MEQKIVEICRMKEILLNNINNFLSKNNWTIKNLSDFSNIPYESTKKLINGKVDNPTIYTICKIADALGCSVDFLLGRRNISSATSKNLPLRSFTLIEEIAKLESHLALENKKNNSLNIPVFVPTGRMKEGFVFDSVTTEYIDISDNYRDSEDIVMCGLKITSSYLAPTYFKNDVLLVARDRYPNIDEIGIFLVKGRGYIRKYASGNVCTLVSINGDCEPIVVKDIADLHFFGRVITTIRR